MNDKKTFDKERILDGLKVKEVTRTKTETVHIVVSDSDEAQDFIFEVHKRFNFGLPDDWIYQVVYECLTDGEPAEPPIYYSELTNWLKNCAVAWDYVDDLIENDFELIDRDHGLWGILTLAYARFAEDVHNVVCELLGIEEQDEADSST